MLTVRRLFSFMGLLGALLSLCACAGTETGNPSAQGSLALRARSSDTEAVTIGEPGGRVRIDSAWISLGAISLVPCDAAASEVLDATAEDLVLLPAARTFERNLDTYCGIATASRLAPTELPATAPPELANRSIVVVGERDDGVPFRLASELGLTLAMNVAPPGFHVDDAGSSLLFAFDLAAWFASVDLTAATADPDGTIRVDSTHHPSLLAAFDGTLGASDSLHHDLDHDGVLDPEELTPIAH